MHFQRIQQTVSSLVTDYLLDVQPGLAVVLQQTADSNVDRFIHGPRGIHAHQDDSGDWFWLVQDGLGSVRGAADDVLAVQGTQHYAPYGQPFGAQGNLGLPFGFTGEQTDEDDLVFLRARYLSPELGAFLSLDPFEGMASRPMSLNGYSWVEGNPVMHVDPSGRQIGGICGIGLGGCVGAAAIPIDGPLGEFVLCTSTVVCLLASGLTLTAAINLVAEEAAKTTGIAIAEAERIVEEAFRRSEDPNDDNDPIRDPFPFFPGDPWPDPNPNRPCPDEEDNCDNHLTDDAAAIVYARTSRGIYNSAMTIATSRGVTNQERRNANFTIGFTRVRSRQTKQCIGVSASSNLYDYMAAPTRNNQNWRDIITDAMQQSTEANVALPVVIGTPSFYIGHAETNIHAFVTVGNFTSYRAMGTSNPHGPCVDGPGGANCQAFFSNIDISIGYIARNGPWIFRRGNRYQLV